MCEVCLEVPVDSTRVGERWRVDPHELGRRGEAVAQRSLLARGWQVLGRNWRTGFGEVDIIAIDPDAPLGTVSLIEVKTRLEGDAGEEILPEVAVDDRRQRRYHNAASLFLQANDWASVVRFDVIAITVSKDGVAHLHHVKDAYGIDG